MIKERREEKEIKSKIIRNRLLVVKVDSQTKHNLRVGVFMFGRSYKQMTAFVK